jgi:hypothetical protein
MASLSILAFFCQEWRNASAILDDPAAGHGKLLIDSVKAQLKTNHKAVVKLACAFIASSNRCKEECI